MSPVAWLMAAGALVAALALVMTIINLGVYRASERGTNAEPGRGAGGMSELPAVSVCIPARNESANIGACVVSLLASDLAGVEVVVYDDQSTDATPRIIDDLVARDSRVRRAQTMPLPPEWNGKQHACWRASQAAAGRWLLFTDADVRFEPDCLRRAVAEAARLKTDLLSTFPRQITGTPGEALFVPMIFFVLFSYLPMPRMRTTRDPATSAGCGQFLLIRREAYDSFGGHAAFRSTMHDGIKMPRATRRAGFKSDLFDGSDLCHVRMYRGFHEAWRGFAKNAYEGLGSFGILVLLTILHAVGHVLPWVVLMVGAARSMVHEHTMVSRWASSVDSPALAFAACAVITNIAQRLTLALRLKQGAAGVLASFTHPVGVLMMTAVQWFSLYLHLAGKRSWRGRVGAHASA